MQDFARFFASDLNMSFIVFPCQEETFDFGVPSDHSIMFCRELSFLTLSQIDTE